MEFNWSILGWIAGLIFVYVFGLVEGRGKGYKKRKAEEEQEKRQQPPPQPQTITVDDPGLLRIKNENGALVLDLDGARVSPIALLPEQRKRLVEILNIMRPWLDASQKPIATMATPLAPSQPKPVPVQTAAPPLRSQPTPQPSTPRPAIIPPEDRPSAPANSIVTQIDTILQEQLKGSALEERGVFLTQSAEGGVIVFVGLTRYHGVDEVPDPEIKAAIRAAIKVWEDKYTPGL